MSDLILQRRLLQVDSSRNINSFANLSLNDSSDEEHHEPDTTAMLEHMEVNPVHAGQPRRAKKRRNVSKWANVVMYAEPLDFASIPEDLQTDWIALAPLPKGKRCIMTTSRSSNSSKTSYLCGSSPLMPCRIYRIPPQSGQRQHSDAPSNKSTVGLNSRLHTR